MDAGRMERVFLYCICFTNKTVIVDIHYCVSGALNSERQNRTRLLSLLCLQRSSANGNCTTEWHSIDCCSHYIPTLHVQWCLARRVLRFTTKSHKDEVFAIAKAITKRCFLWGNFALRWLVPCFGNQFSQNDDFRPADQWFQNGRRVKKWPPAVFWDGFLAARAAKMAALWRIFTGRWVSSP